MPISIPVDEKDNVASDYRDKHCKVELIVIAEG